MRNKIPTMLLVIFSLILTGCGGGGTLTESDENKIQREIYAMDTIMNLTIYGDQAGEVMDQAVALINRLDNLFSVTNPKSDIAKINSADGAVVEVSEETHDLIEKSLSISDETGGVFDISIYPLVKEWGFTTENYHIPSSADRKAALKKVDYTKIKLLSDNRIQIGNNMQIDLGAVAKGYLSQKLMELFKKNGITSAIVSLGGNVQTMGRKEDGSSFRVGLVDPSDGASIYGTLDVQDQAVITSGIYQRYFTENGKQYHHIMDKRTGMPADNDLASVTVIAKDGAAADALATALYVMGEEKAIEYQKAHPEFQMILIRKDGSCWQSDQVKLHIER